MIRSTAEPARVLPPFTQLDPCWTATAVTLHISVFLYTLPGPFAVLGVCDA